MSAYVGLSLVSSSSRKTQALWEQGSSPNSTQKPQLGKDPCWVLGPGTSAGNLGAAGAGPPTSAKWSPSPSRAYCLVL